MTVGGEGIRDTRMFRFGESVINGVVEALWLCELSSHARPALGTRKHAMAGKERTGPVSVELDLLLHVPTRSVKSAACAATKLAPRSRDATETSMARRFGKRGKASVVTSVCAGRRWGRGVVRRVCQRSREAGSVGMLATGELLPLQWRQSRKGPRRSEGAGDLRQGPFAYAALAACGRDTA